MPPEKRSEEGRIQRLFVPVIFTKARTVALAPQQAHYVGGVIRLPVGGAILLFNGRDGEWRARRAEGGKREVRLIAEEAATRPQGPPGLIDYAFAPLKHARLD